MCENESLLPEYIECLDENNEKYNELREKIEIINVCTHESSEKMSSTELRLRRWFKCTQFEDKCFATRNTCQQFLSHLTDKHFGQQLFCLYCHNINDENKQFYGHEDLISHIRSTHSYRQFQCNLCLFRSISVNHLIIHQSSVHSRNFDVTVNKTIDNNMNNGLKECKIIECTQLAERPKPDLHYYYNNFKDQRINDELRTNQCVYCKYTDSNKDELYAHCVAAHSDFPIIIYNGINIENAENDGSDNTLNDENIKKGKKRSFDETDVTSNGVVDTYEFDIWTESEDEDMLSMLTEDDLSSDGEPDLKRSKSENSEQPIASSSGINSDNSILHMSQKQFYVAFCISALFALYLSVVLSR